MAASPLRFGILGAARIAPPAIVRPAREVPGVELRLEFGHSHLEELVEVARGEG